MEARGWSSAEARGEEARHQNALPDSRLDKKKLRIRRACHQRDYAELAKLASSDGGFLTDDLRREICM